MYRGDYKRMVREGEGKYGKVKYYILHGKKEGACYRLYYTMLLGAQDESWQKCSLDLITKEVLSNLGEILQAW